MNYSRCSQWRGKCDRHVTRLRVNDALFFPCFQDTELQKISGKSRAFPRKILATCLWILMPLFLICTYNWHWWNAVAQWLRYCAINLKVVGSIPDGVIGIFHWHISFWSYYGPGVDSASNRNEYQNISWGYMRPECKADNLTTILCRPQEIWEP
jgi:hypothetical protein